MENLKSHQKHNLSPSQRASGTKSRPYNNTFDCHIHTLTLRRLCSWIFFVNINADAIKWPIMRYLKSAPGPFRLQHVSDGREKWVGRKKVFRGLKWVFSDRTFYFSSLRNFNFLTRIFFFFIKIHQSWLMWGCDGALSRWNGMLMIKKWNFKNFLRCWCRNKLQ